MQVPTQQAIQLKTVIYIGASSVSMLIKSDLTGEEIDFLEKSTPLAHDVFSRGTITKSSIERTSKIISGYLNNVQEYGEQRSENINIYASNILSEASNKENFLTRLQIACGFPIKILDDGEMSRLLYLKTRRRLKDTPAMQKRTTLVLHVGPSNTRTILFNQGKIIAYQSYRLGTHRTAEAIDSLHMKGKALQRVIQEHAGSSIFNLLQDNKKNKVEEVVVIGYEIQNLSTSILKTNTNKLYLKELKTFSDKLADQSIDQIVRESPLDYQSAEAVLPALEINHQITSGLGVKYVRVPETDFERGLLLDLSIERDSAEGFEQEVINSAWELAKKYQVHVKHAKQVMELCERLFENLQDIHGLRAHDLLLLRAAALTHEVGGYIQPKAHHKHSLYILMNSEIFGLGQNDVNIIALISRYHRNSPPKANHSIYRDLSMSEQIRVSKLAAILRVADALDRAHSSRINKIQIKVKRRKLFLVLDGVHDAAVERLAMQSKGDLLQDIFGLEIVINEAKD